MKKYWFEHAFISLCSKEGSIIKATEIKTPKTSKGQRRINTLAKSRRIEYIGYRPA